MKTGDKVFVFPQGQRSKGAAATVAILSANERAIAVGFQDRPPFRWDDPLSMAVHPEYGLMLFASRRQPFGPWEEMTCGWHYEIEEIV